VVNEITRLSLLTIGIWKVIPLIGKKKPEQVPHVKKGEQLAQLSS